MATGPKGQPLPAHRRARIFASPRARRLADEQAVQLSELTATGPQGMIVERDVRTYLESRPEAPAITPVARRLAEARGLDVTVLQAERPSARVTRADVEAALAQLEAVDAEGVQWLDVPPIRRTIARRMVESQQAAAEVTLTRDVDATELVELRRQILEELSEGDPRPTFTDILVAIVARELRRHPRANATWDGQRIGLYTAVHVAVAVDTDRGLVTPVVRNADMRGLLDLTTERARLVQQALDGTIGPDDLTGGTFTITNLGPIGIDAFTPIINPPQTGILGVGRIRPAAAVHNGELCIRQRMFLSLTFDHRIIDGAPAARFLMDIVRLIEKPHLIWL
jgi:pyruvate dehydrogenase E2 component (dihydrolipoamide acetyltransferase)